MLSAVYHLDEALEYARTRAVRRYKYVRYHYNGDKDDLRSVGQLAVIELTKTLGNSDMIPEDKLIRAVDKAVSKEIYRNKSSLPLPRVINKETGEWEEVVFSRVSGKHRDEVVKVLDDFYYELQACAGKERSDILWLKYMMHLSDAEIIEHYAKKNKILTSGKIEYAVKDAIAKIRLHLKPETVNAIAALKPYIRYSDAD